MRVHNSSLTFSPLGPNQKTGKNNSAQNNDPALAKDAQHNKVNQPSSTEEIKNTLDNNNLSIDFTNSNIIKPTDSRTLRAPFRLQPGIQCSTARSTYSIDNRNRYLRLINLTFLTYETAFRIFPYRSIFYRI